MNGLFRTAAAVPLAICLAAAEPSATVAVTMTAKPSQVAVGDPVAVEIEYRWPAAWSCREPDPGPAFAGSFVTEAPPAQRLDAGGEAVRRFRLTVLAAASGAWELPRPVLAAAGPRGAATATAPLVVVQVGAEAQPPKLPAPRPAWVRAPEAERPRWGWWAGGGALLALLAGGGLWLALRRRAAAEVRRTPAERFADALLAAQGARDGHEAGAALSLALRTYAGEVWGFDGAGATAREAAARVRATAPDEESAGFARLMDDLDGLRWAAGELPRPRIDPFLDDARRWQSQVQARLDAEAARKAAS